MSAVAAAITHCAVCLRSGSSRVAAALCAWPVPSIVNVPWRAIKVGDVWVTNQKRLRGRVVEIEPIEHASRFWVQIPGHKDVYPYDRYGEMVVETERGNEKCSAPACFRHRREVGPSRFYCADHWNSWTEVK